MKLKVRRTKMGPDGYELFNGDTDRTIKSGLTAAQVYEEILMPQTKATLTAIGRFVAEADSRFAESQPAIYLQFDDDTALDLASPNDIKLPDDSAAPPPPKSPHPPASK